MRYLWLSIVLLCFSCGRPRYPLGQPIELHADPEFTYEERALISTACDRLAAVGVNYVVMYDTDPGNRMRRVTAVQMEALDTIYAGKIYGATTLDKPFRIFIFWERLDTTKMFLHVVLHELAHGAGAEHVDDPRAVMFRLSRPGTFDAVWFNETDLRELTR